ncbi:hypothetical protein MTO96_044250 [Rhipicephalus appendiculatus]
MDNPRVVDLRSDTVTRPTPEMRRAMMCAAVGDDVFKEDPNRQRRVCQGVLREVWVASVHSWAVPTQKGGRLLIEDLESRVRYRDIPCPRTALLCLENTHNLSGGTVLPVDYVEQASRFARSHKIPLHMDGARILNAATYLGLPARDILRGVSLRGNPYVGVDLETVQTNIAVYDFHDPCRLSPQTFCERLHKVTQREFEDLQQAVEVKMRAVSPTKARAVLHNDVGADDVEAAVAKIRYVIEELCRPDED